MVFGIQGPKSILSSAIAKALAQFFVVDAKQIESNLLKDTQFVLKNVLLRTQVARLPMNSAGKPTLITVTGCVKEVTFTWTWAVGSNKDEKNADAWVRDSKLTLKGLEFKAQLTYGTGDEELTIPPPQSTEESVPLDSAQAAAVQKQGGFQKWLTQQVEFIIDSLDLLVQDFQFTVEIPPPLTKPENSNDSKETMSIVMNGTKLENISSGRHHDTLADSVAVTPPSVIQQQVSFGSLSIIVIETTSTGSTTTCPVLEPFGYGADLTRSSGQRFSGFATGLVLIGKPTAENTGSSDSVLSEIVLHVGTTQLEAITQLGIMLLAPPGDGTGDTENTNHEESKESNEQDTAVNGNKEKTSSNTHDISNLQKESDNAMGGVRSNESEDHDDQSSTQSSDESQNENGTPPKEELKGTRKSNSTIPEGQGDATLEDKADGTGTGAEASENEGALMTTEEDPSRGDATNTTDEGQEANSEENGTHTYTTPNYDEATVSVFVLPMKSLCIVLDGNAKIMFPLLVVSYEADGTVLDITANACRMKTILSAEASDEEGPTFAMSGVKFELRPRVEFRINEITEIYIPEVIRLTKPIENPRISFQDNILSIDVDSIDAKVPRENVESAQEKEATAGSLSDASGTSMDSVPDEDSEDDLSAKNDTVQKVEESVGSAAESESKASVGGASKDTSPGKSTSSEASIGQEDTADKPGSSSVLPFPFILSVNDISMKMIDGSFTRLHHLDLFANPNQKSNSNDLAVCLDAFDSKLLQFEKFNLCAQLPLDKPNEIQSLAVTAKSGRVSAGHSTNDWAQNFQPRPSAKQPHEPKPKNAPSDSNSSIDLKLPFASVSALNVKVSWKGRGVQIKDTEVSVKPFKGDADTTSKDLIEYYAGACLSRVPGFISNADVLGINVVDHTASTYGTVLGQGLFGTYMGAVGGAAAIAAVDGVKGAMKAGKMSRDAENGARWQPGDLVRGVIYSVGQATKTGALQRGRGDDKGHIAEEVADFLVGASTDSEEYVSENIVKLGAATGGGLGTIGGALVAGPIGGIIGGLLASAVTGKAIEDVKTRTNTKLELEADQSK